MAGGRGKREAEGEVKTLHTASRMNFQLFWIDKVSIGAILGVALPVTLNILRGDYPRNPISSDIPLA